jgi:hypothetical protein
MFSSGDRSVFLRGKCAAFLAIERRSPKEKAEGLMFSSSFAETAQHFWRLNGVRQKNRSRI